MVGVHRASPLLLLCGVRTTQMGDGIRDQDFPDMRPISVFAVGCLEVMYFVLFGNALCYLKRHRYDQGLFT